MRSRNFNAGSGLSVHIRTTRVDTPRGISFSYISGAAVQIGRNLFEVFNNGSILMDGNNATRPFDFNDSEHLSSTSTSFADHYTLTISMKGSKGRIVLFNLDLHNDKRIKIRSNTKSGMIFVDIDGYFEDSEGLLGSPPDPGSNDGKLLSRDRTMDMTGNWNAYGEEWQVRNTDSILFQERRYPQYPAGCVYEDQSAGKEKTKVRRRLLGNNAHGVAREMALEACAHAVGKMKAFCIDDVLTTGDVELAMDPFYI